MKQLTQDECVEVYVLLKEIVDKIGPYKMDNHEHAISVIDHSSENAKRVIEILSIDNGDLGSIDSQQIRRNQDE